MQAIVRNWNELSDSREMLEAKPSPIVSSFIYILLLLIAGALTWSYFGERDIVVKTGGVVRPNEKISTIKTKVAGNAVAIFYESGQKVHKGQLLLELDAQALNQQMVTLTQQRHEKTDDLALLGWFKRSVESDSDHFPIESRSSEYYEQYLKYKLDRKQLQGETDRNQADMRKMVGEQNYNFASLKRQESGLSADLNGMRLLRQSIMENRSLFPDSTDVYAQQYQLYQLRVEQLQAAIEDKESTYKASANLGEDYVPRLQLEEQKRAWEAAQSELEKYRSDTLAALLSGIRENERKLAEIQASLKKDNYEAGIAQASKEQLEIAAEKFKQDKIVEIGQTIKTYEEQLKDIEDKIKQTELADQDFKIVSPMDGIVNVVAEVNKGDLIEAGTELLTVIPERDSEYSVRLTVHNKDIADIHVGDKIKYHFMALPYQEYGELTGTITRISSDARFNQQDGQNYYTVEASIQNKPLYSYKGAEAQIKVGMVCEAYVVTESKKILYDVLEKLDLKK